jgi:hypothetical protein
LFKSTEIRFDRLLTEEGSVPPILVLDWKFSMSRYTRLPILLGIVPVRDFPFKFSRCTRAGNTAELQTTSDHGVEPQISTSGTPAVQLQPAEVRLDFTVNAAARSHMEESSPSLVGALEDNSAVGTADDGKPDGVSDDGALLLGTADEGTADGAREEGSAEGIGVDGITEGYAELGDAVGNTDGRDDDGIPVGVEDGTKLGAKEDGSTVGATLGGDVGTEGPEVEGTPDDGILLGAKQPWSLNFELSRASDTMFDSRHNEDGIEPVNEFELRISVLSEVSCPSELGTWPTREFLNKFTILT